VWPVTIDPYLKTHVTGQDDLFVSSRDYAGVNTSAFPDLTIGTYDWGGEKAAAYLHFDLSGLAGKAVTGGTLKLYNYWSFSCTKSQAWVYEVTQNWSGQAYSWPGPSYNTSAISVAEFANGYTNCPTQDWATWTLPISNVQAWVDNPSNFKGLTVRASTTDALGWKRFRSYDYSYTSKRPRLEVTYIDPIGVEDVSPKDGDYVGSLTPTLWVRPQNTPGLQVQFQACLADDEGDPVLSTCQTSQWLAIPIWKLPAGLIPKWSQTVLWRIQVKVGSTIIQEWPEEYYRFTVRVPQPPITSHLSGAGDGAEIAGVNPQAGNYTTAAIDASVAVAGPPLATVRTYNSQDPRTDGGFGPGWSTLWDQKVVQDDDGSGNVVVTLASGRQVRFGRNVDGSYAPPPGERLDFVLDSGTWILRDPTGTRRLFSYPDGKLLKV
ncbi:MAG: DNRLRE domain-containing protein, partial [Dactylosporangium sp.]|nr:DNRLRE domain-containing protein [Dactylosporangium sp.]